jgi:hypothetical protein
MYVQGPSRIDTHDSWMLTGMSAEVATGGKSKGCVANAGVGVGVGVGVTVGEGVGVTVGVGVGVAAATMTVPLIIVPCT